MQYLVKRLLQGVIDDMDSGNSNLSENDCISIMKCIKEYANKDIDFSKYQAYTYLNMSRAKFDNLVRDGKLPKGKKIAGFKELRWDKKELDEYVRRGIEKDDKGKQLNAS